jgi:hypothetical protein
VVYDVTKRSVSDAYSKGALEEQDGDALRKEVSLMLTTKETLLHKRVRGFIERKR